MNNTSPNRWAHGEQHYGAKLTEFDVRVIRKMAQAKVSQAEIGRSFPQVSLIAIFNVVHRKSWKHLPEESI